MVALGNARSAGMRCRALIGTYALCCFVLCCAVLCCAVLCYAVLCCAVLCGAVVAVDTREHAVAWRVFSVEPGLVRMIRETISCARAHGFEV